MERRRKWPLDDVCWFLRAPTTSSCPASSLARAYNNLGAPRSRRQGKIERPPSCRSAMYTYNPFLLAVHIAAEFLSEIPHRFNVCAFDEPVSSSFVGHSQFSLSLSIHFFNTYKKKYHGTSHVPPDLKGRREVIRRSSFSAGRTFWRNNCSLRSTMLYTL